MLRTHISLFSCWTNADIEVFTGLEIRRRGARLAHDECPCNVLNKTLTLYLTNVKPLGIVISNMLLLSAPATEATANTQYTGVAHNCKSLN